MAQLALFPYSDTLGGDTFEIAYAHSYPDAHWSPDSLYFRDDDTGMQLLAPSLRKVMPNYAFYGPQKITLAQWDAVKRQYLADSGDQRGAEAFFDTVASWLQKGNRGAGFFWILGI